MERPKRHNWFRKTTWTAKDQEEFWTRHRRSRGNYNKSQYLRIQASHLAQTGEPALLDAAMELLNRSLDEFPEPSQLSCHLMQRGDIFLRRGQIDEALGEFRAAISRERVYPSARTQCWISFGWVASVHRRVELFDEVEKVISERCKDALFRIDFYRMHAIHAMIAMLRGDRICARQHAEAALREATKTHSGFRYHSKLGLVNDTDSVVRKQLEELLIG